MQPACVSYRRLLKVCVCLLALLVAYRWSHYIQMIDPLSLCKKILLFVFALGVVFACSRTLTFDSKTCPNLSVRRAYVHPGPIKQSCSTSCLPEGSHVIFNPLEDAYLPLPPRSCYGLEDLEHILRSRKKLLSNSPLTNDEQKYVDHVIVLAKSS